MRSANGGDRCQRENGVANRIHSLFTIPQVVSGTLSTPSQDRPRQNWILDTFGMPLPAHLGLTPNTEARMTSRPCFRPWLSLAVLLVFVAPSAASAQGIERPRIPLVTALGEIRSLREAYADASGNRHKAIPQPWRRHGGADAIVIQGDGSVLVGNDAIRKALAADAPTWPQMTITSDTVRVCAGHNRRDASDDAYRGRGVVCVLPPSGRSSDGCLANWKIGSYGGL